MFLWVGLDNMFLRFKWDQISKTCACGRRPFSGVHLKAFKRFLRVLGALLVPLDVFKDHTNPLQGTFLRGRTFGCGGYKMCHQRNIFQKHNQKTPRNQKTSPRGVYLPPPRETRIFKEGEIPSLSHRPNPIVRSMRYRLWLRLVNPQVGDRYRGWLLN